MSIIAQRAVYTAPGVQQNGSREGRESFRRGAGWRGALAASGAFATFVTLGAVASLSLAEWKILARLYADPPSLAFVVESVRGVLAGTPVSKSWAHRLLAPLLVALLGGPNGEAVLLFTGLALLAANGLLFVLLRWRGVSRSGAALGVTAFGLARLVLAYKLEYPWDGVDQLVFLAFGAWAARGGGLWRFVPILAVGTLNHETILYVPLYYLIGALVGLPHATSGMRRALSAGAALGVVAAAVAGLRALRYVGQPALPGQVFEPPTPLVENHLHVAHNLEQLFVRNWSAGRMHVSVGLLVAIAVLAGLARKPGRRVAALWSLVVIGSILAFGYVNETRHYVILVAFWIAYAWRDREPKAAADSCA